MSFVLSLLKIAAFLVFISLSDLMAQDAQACKENVVVVSALDTRGIPAKNLATKDFKISFRGGPAVVAWSQYREDPSGRVLILLGTSGSMQDWGNGSNKWKWGNASNKWKIARGMASEFVSSAPPGKQISLMSFAETVKENFPAAGGRAAIQEWLSKSPALEGKQLKGPTALYETLLAAINGLAPAQPGDSIYIITDGGDNWSKARSSRVERSLVDSGIRLFAFLLYGTATMPTERTGAQELNELVRHSGGFLVSLDAQPNGLGWSHFDYDSKVQRDMERATRMLQALMSDFYVLGIDGLGASVKSRNWSLEVVDSRGRKRKDLVLAYRRETGSCLGTLDN